MSHDLLVQMAYIVLRSTAPMRQNCRRKITGQRYFKNGCERHVIDTARGQVIHGSLHIDSLICYLLYLVYHYISYVYPCLP